MGLWTTQCTDGLGIRKSDGQSPRLIPGVAAKASWQQTKDNDKRKVPLSPLSVELVSLRFSGPDDPVSSSRSLCSSSSFNLPPLLQNPVL